MATVENEKLAQEIAESERYLLETRTLLAEHIEKAHSGWPASTCHRCLSYQQGIQSNTRFIEEARPQLAQIKR